MPLKTSEATKPTCITDVEVLLNAHDFVEVTQEGDRAIVKPKRFLSDTAFYDLHNIIKKVDGTYVSAGKNSHWEVPLSKGKPAKKCERCGNQTFTPTVYEGKTLCAKCAGDIKASLEQPAPKIDSKKPISFQPFQMIPTEAILSMPFQIRQTKEIDSELADSIRQVGVVEPIIVRPKESGRFECVAGGRRLSHAKEVGLDQIPCVVRLLTDEEALEIQLIENVQRKDVSDIEIAHWLDQLMKFPEKYPTQDALAKKIGKSREWVTRHLSMVRLEESNIVPRGTMDKLDEGHTREILSAPIEKRQEIVEKIAEHIEETGKPLSVKEIHEIAHPETPTPLEETTEPEPSEPQKPKPQQIDMGTIFHCKICNEDYTIIHVGEGKHRFEKVTVM